MDAGNISPGYLKKINDDSGSRDIQTSPGTVQHNMVLLARYNLEKFSELLDMDCVDVPEKIDSARLEDFTLHINQYMDEHASGQTDLKVYVRIISLYLTFIAKMPLHPPGMMIYDAEKIFKQGGTYYCPGKSMYILEPGSLCRYCVCMAPDKNSTLSF